MSLHQRMFLTTLFSLLALSTANTCEDCQEAVGYPPKNDCSTSSTLVSISTFDHRGVKLVELLGPSDLEDSAAVVIAAPHGGSEKLTDEEIPVRDCDSCKTLKDSYTLEISLALGQAFIDNYCKVPYIVVNYLHRSKLDANREIDEAAMGNQIAEAAWRSFHNFIAQAQLMVESQHGSVLGDFGRNGIRGLMFDVHGYSGKDWVPTHGSPFIQWGYRLSENTLDPTLFCPVDNKSSGTIGTFSHARTLPGKSLECLVRGQTSLGSRINALLPIAGATSNGSEFECGTGMPSFEFQSPKAMANDATYCAKSGGDCHYYSGGFDTKVHEHVDWDSKDVFFSDDDLMMNTVQAEFPRCLRFASGSNSRTTVHNNLAGILSEGICGFLVDLFQDETLC